MRRIEIDEGELLQLHRVGMTSKEIAKHFGCCFSTICNRLRKHEIHGITKKIERTTGPGYAAVLRPDHPRADERGCVLRSVLNWEAYHKRPFPRDREPHHLNGNRLDDRPGNILSLLHSEHMALHAWLRRERRKSV